MISKALESASSPEEQAKIKALEESLKGGKLKTGGMKAEVIGQVSLLQQALKDAGMSEKEVADILAKATSEGLSQGSVHQSHLSYQSAFQFCHLPQLLSTQKNIQFHLNLHLRVNVQF